jgi:hypothetical protein
MLAAPRGGHLTRGCDETGANRVSSERLWARRQRRRDYNAAQVAVSARGEETPSEPKS